MLIYLTGFISLIIIYKFLSGLNPEKKQVEIDLESDNLEPRTKRTNKIKKLSLEDKYQAIEAEIDSYRILDNFISHCIKTGYATREEFNFILKDIYSKYSRILLNVKNTEDILYQNQDFIVLNIEVLIWSLKRKCPIYVDKFESTTVH